MLRLRHGARALQLASQGLCACRLHHAVRCTNSAVLQTGSSLASRRDLAYSSAVVASTSSTVAEVCEWAGRAVAERGAGLSDTDVDILQREKISGGSLFTLTDAELQSVGFTLGARKDLLAAVALLKDPQGTRLLLSCASVTSEALGCASFICAFIFLQLCCSQSAPTFLSW